MRVNGPYKYCSDFNLEAGETYELQVAWASVSYKRFGGGDTLMVRWEILADGFKEEPIPASRFAWPCSAVAGLARSFPFQLNLSDSMLCTSTFA